MKNQQEEYYVDDACARGIRMSRPIIILFILALGLLLYGAIDPTDWSKVEGRLPITGKTAEETTDDWFGKDWYGPRKKQEGRETKPRKKQEGRETK